jgi:site-specific DNA-cytosine methylase
MVDLQVLELFAGIGGAASVLGEDRITAAIDINREAGVVYQANFSGQYHIREIESISDSEFRRWNSDLWWLSPPCQPYSRRGKFGDLQDTRSCALLRIIDALSSCQPAHLALENVVGFQSSEACARLAKWLDSSGYKRQSIELCPTDFGWPNRRPRFYLIASKLSLVPWQPLKHIEISWTKMIEPIQFSGSTKHLWLSVQDQAKYLAAFDRMIDGVNRPTACFAGSYGKTWIHAGSYLQTPEGLRRFSPREVARFLGFPETFVLPELDECVEQTDRKLWKLLGNSLSLPAVRYVLSHLC